MSETEREREREAQTSEFATAGVCTEKERQSETEKK